MELLVGALAVLGLLAIVIRFLPRDTAGNVRLPRIVDDSIGMWLLRRATGRRLWERPWDDDGPAAERGAAAAGRAGPAAGEGAPHPSPGPIRVTPTRSVVSRSQAHPVTPVSPLYRPAGGRRHQARRRGLPGLAPRLGLVAGAAAAAVIGGVVVFGAVLGPRGEPGDGEVLGATGTPDAAPASAATIATPGAAAPSMTGTTGASGSAWPTAAGSPGPGLGSTPTPTRTSPPAGPSAVPPAPTRPPSPRPSRSASPSQAPSGDPAPSSSVDPVPSVDPSPSADPLPSIDPTPSVEPIPSADPSGPA